MTTGRVRSSGGGGGRRTTSGVSFIEILIAAGILVAVMLPLFALSTHNVRTSQVGLDELLGTSLTSEVIEQMKVLPFTAGFPFIVTSPFPNPPPQFPNWSTLPDTGISLPEANPNVSPSLPALNSQGWTQFGYNYWRPPPDDGLIAARSRLWLSPLPGNHVRRLKIYRPLRDATGARDPNLFQLTVQLLWDRKFLGSPTQSRANLMGTLIANPVFNP